MSMLTTFLERLIFGYRKIVVGLFLLATVYLGFQASMMHLDAGFEKNVPLNHPYMQTYMKHRKDFGGANSVLVSVCDASGNIYNQTFMDTLQQVHDALFFVNGVDRSLVVSLFAPSTRFTEIVEGGFSGGPVIPADFDSSRPEALKQVAVNVEKAKIVGRQVSNDYSCAMVTTQLLDFDPKTGEPLDMLAIADALEQDVRQQFETDDISIHIIGFSKMIGDVANGAKDVVLFFAIALAITAVMVYFFSRNIMMTILPLACSIVAVVWQLGLLTVLGFGLDPMSILVPFLVFAIGVSHGVQMINAVEKKAVAGMGAQHAA